MLRPSLARSGWTLAILCACAATAAPALAQLRPTSEGGRTRSLGLPLVWDFTVGASSPALDLSGTDAVGAQARFGATRSIGNPVVQGLTFNLEAYAGTRRNEFDGGLRARLGMPISRVTWGLDFNGTSNDLQPVWSYTHPGRRGGLFIDGTLFRVDWHPTRDRSLTVGLEIPLRRDVPTGRTRPTEDRVHLTGPPRLPPPTVLPQDAVLSASLDEMADASEWIRQLAVPFLGRDDPGRGPAVPTSLAELHRRFAMDATGTTVESEARRFHDALARALGRVLGDGPNVTPSRGEPAARAMRQILLDEVLLPYDRLLGQVRAPDTIRRFGYRAQGRYRIWLHAAGGASPAQSDQAMTILTFVIDLIEEARARTSAAWLDARFSWLPLQYGLRPEEHDQQEELDALVERATEERFTDGNFASYVINEQFQLQLRRTIAAAEEYHVLVTHDFRGYDDRGFPDVFAYEAAQAYLAAMTARVKAYDGTGRFPTYLIIHDMWYYSLRGAPLFLTLLEDPTHHRVRLPRAYRRWEETLAAAQEELRRAIAGSALLQAQRQQYGDDWLRALVKVHVNVTNRPDPTFWSWTLIPGLPIQDNMLRDHRKLAFYDVSEQDPNRGQAIYTGAGVGEHYANDSWEDRSLLVQGPANLGLKYAVRQLLLDHGFREDRIPYPLQPRPLAPGYEALVSSTASRASWPVRALGAHNGSGYLPKDVNVAKAVLYTLMPSGSVIAVPDSFWNSEFWGAALFGAALRGVRVMVIAPSYASNSVEVPGTQLLGRELLSRMLAARQAFAPQIRASEGTLLLGVFDTDVGVTDLVGKAKAVQRTFRENEALQAYFGFPPTVWGELDQLIERYGHLAAPVDTTGVIERDLRTRIHLKSNLFASREAWTMMGSPWWGQVLRSFFGARFAQVQTRRSGLQEPLLEVATGEVQAWRNGLADSTRQRVVFYSIMGSQNQNTRSMVMDAEVALVVARWPGVIPWIDVVALAGQSHWVDSQGDIDRFMPPMGKVRTAMTHWARLAY